MPIATFAVVVLTACAALHAAAVANAEPPTAPPARICGDAEVLTGPVTPPEGAVVVPAGDHSGVRFNRPGTTYWFAPGVHTLGDDVYGQIIAGEGVTYIGGPGAVIDGQNLNLYAFTNDVSDVTIKYLTIRNFGRGLDNNNEGVVNHDSGSGWTISNNTITGNDGAGVFVGPGNVVASNCLKDNGQYGFSMFRPPIEGESAITDIVLDRNEVVGNNTDDWESHVDGCGCTGGGKFWDVRGARITDNWIHDNRGAGLWADTNNIDFLIEGNYIEANDGEGIWYEISYNATIRDNVLRRNAWVSGRSNTGSPGAAVYLSESGGDARLPSEVSGAPQVRIYGNSFEDNFSGVSIYENANRFCNSNGNTSKGYCTPFVHPTLIPEEGRDYEYVNPISSLHPCYTSVASEPYRTDCRWHSKNIEVYDNDFRFDDTVVPCAGSYCGAQALYATGADNIPWAPYTVRGVQNAVMFENGNRFRDNRYVGNWRFATGYGETTGFTAWRAAPYGQDAGSTFDGETGPPPPPGPAPTPGDIDADTSTLEGSIGEWVPWYSSAIERSDEEAHGGAHSLQVDVTEPHGWGVELANWPGFTSTHGLKRVSFWAKLGAGAELRPNLKVTWRGDDGGTVRSQTISAPVLTSTWQRVSALVDVPARTATVLVALTGQGKVGDRIYVDDVTVGDAPNVLDADSAGFEGGLGEWQAWYAAEISASTEASYRGTGSLAVRVTAPHGWGAQVGNWPGFAASPGEKRISYWAKRGPGALAGVTLRVRWMDAAGSTIEETRVASPDLGEDWQQAVATVTAPPATASAYVDLTGSGKADDTAYVDDVVITAASGT